MPIKERLILLRNGHFSSNIPAKLADIKQTILPTIKALIATDVIRLLLVGAITPSDPIKIPKELGLAKPQIANVVIPILRGYIEHINI